MQYFRIRKLYWVLCAGIYVLSLIGDILLLRIRYSMPLLYRYIKAGKESGIMTTVWCARVGTRLSINTRDSCKL